MEYVLDNPVYNALLSGNQHLAYGTSEVKYFDKEVSPFVGLQENTNQNLDTLYDLLPDDTARGLMVPGEMKFDHKWSLQAFISGYQMVYSLEGCIEADFQHIVPLTNVHVPQMQALTQLTSPGPFAGQTIRFGHYQGIFMGNQLIAMAGHRLQTYSYTEISAVCTHPNHSGKGYAQQLLQFQIQHILNAGQTPYLHVRGDNYRAIKVYEKLGFIKRMPINFYFIKKNS